MAGQASFGGAISNAKCDAHRRRTRVYRNTTQGDSGGSGGVGGEGGGREFSRRRDCRLQQLLLDRGTGRVHPQSRNAVAMVAWHQMVLASHAEALVIDRLFGSYAMIAATVDRVERSSSDADNERIRQETVAMLAAYRDADPARFAVGWMNWTGNGTSNVILRRWRPR
jgi:hypothetical protein